MVFLTRTARFFWREPAFKKLYFRAEGFCKYGLYRDDLDNWLNPINQEALRRLPADEYDQYVYRVVRASQLEFTKSYLPENEQVTLEEDETKGRYLQPYIRQVLKEKEEKEAWQKYLSKD